MRWTAASPGGFVLGAKKRSVRARRRPRDASGRGATAGVRRARATRRLLDVGHRIDRLAVAQHLEVQVGPGRAPGVAEPRDDLAALHGVADGDEIRRVVRVAGHVAVAVIDLDELAVTLTRPGPDHDARADRQHLAALAAGKVDPLVERAAAGERIGPLAEARRDVPRRDRTAA